MAAGLIAMQLQRNTPVGERSILLRNSGPEPDKRNDWLGDRIRVRRSGGRTVWRSSNPASSTSMGDMTISMFLGSSFTNRNLTLVLPFS